MGTRGWYDVVALTQSRGIAIAALPWTGQAIAVFLGIVVVVVVVVVAGRVVVVVVEPVVVVTGTVVVVATVVVEGIVVVVVVVAGRVVVVVVVVNGPHMSGMVVVVVVANAGSSWADVAEDVVRIIAKQSDVVRSEQRRSQWFERRVTQRMYNALPPTPDRYGNNS
jgi:hypothetical protein